MNLSIHLQSVLRGHETQFFFKEKVEKIYSTPLM